jgi:hypothetical protein
MLQWYLKYFYNPEAIVHVKFFIVTFGSAVNTTQVAPLGQFPEDQARFIHRLNISCSNFVFSFDSFL